MELLIVIAARPEHHAGVLTRADQPERRTIMRTTDTTTRAEVRESTGHRRRAGSDRVAVIGRSASGQPRTYRLVRPSRTRSVAAAYRHLLVVLLGLDPDTLISELRAERAGRARSAVPPALAA
jgi:hypothetical protein